MAPGEGQKPLNMLSDENFEEMAFPLCVHMAEVAFQMRNVKNINENFSIKDCWMLMEGLPKI